MDARSREGIMSTVFRTLLILTHFVCDLFTAAHNCCVILYRKCTAIWRGENLRTEVEWLVRAATRTKTLPRHVVVVFGAKEDTILDCVRIIGWCVALGIPYISFYDINGNAQLCPVVSLRLLTELHSPSCSLWLRDGFPPTWNR